MKRKGLMVAAALVASLAACSSGGADNSTGTGNGNGNGTGTGTGNGAVCTAGDGTICVQGTSFNPIDITINKNASATWREVAGVHHIVFDTPVASGVTDIGDFSDGSVSRTFTQTGTFPYHCTIHGGVGTGMHGNVIVQ